MIINTLKGLFVIIEYGIDNRKWGSGINFLPYEYFAHVTSETDDLFYGKDLSTLTISARLHLRNTNIYANSYSRTSTDKDVDLLHNIITKPLELHIPTILLKNPKDKQETAKDNFDKGE